MWDPVTQKNIRKLEMVQRRAARFVVLVDLHWIELQDRRKQAKVIMLYRIIKTILIAIPPAQYF